MLPSDPISKYLGVTIVRKLNYCKYLEGCANKIAKRNCILRKLARTTWGASQSALRTSTLALCYSAAEYCTPVWTRSPKNETG
ncbi:RNA-directed DNA polymerase from mobile element jockey-like [Elysia marginata]|uniref:RNA-directed DNA polymerase from mobile element jockey-like n=1 Tax=Elysia marginata TaxID=1093978 RepID=A0AAV4HG87_9GAST|nr:RNA-directed DNA polymerase from mobile element jockey-like [Elysia marginata]